MTNAPETLLHQASGVDVFGDIHGHALALEGALSHLGYRKEGPTTWRPTEGRVALFLGDLIDRGPHNRAVVDVVRGMVERGEAVCLMGNHELNAIHFAMSSSDGGWLRPRSDKNLFQTIRFLVEYADEGGRKALARDIEWFNTLPLFVHAASMQAVHACWSPKHLQTLAPYAAASKARDAAFWRDASDEQTRIGEAVEVALKGLEEPLPGGAYMLDKDGNQRRRARMKWWTPVADFLEAALIPRQPAEHWETIEGALRDSDVPGSVRAGAMVPTQLTFFGHYWMTPKNGAPWCDELSKSVCLDFSVGKGGRGLLGVYRWNGEAEARSERLFGVDASGRRVVGAAG